MAKMLLIYTNIYKRNEDVGYIDVKWTVYAYWHQQTRREAISGIKFHPITSDEAPGVE